MTDQKTKSNWVSNSWIIIPLLIFGWHFSRAIEDTREQLTKVQQRQLEQARNFIKLHDNSIGNDVKYLGRGELGQGDFPPTGPDGETYLKVGADGRTISEGGDSGNREPTPYFGSISSATSAFLSDASTGNRWDLYALYDETGRKCWYAKHRPEKGEVSPSFTNSHK
jgi:hypothetical protein